MIYFVLVMILIFTEVYNVWRCVLLIEFKEVTKVFQGLNGSFNALDNVGLSVKKNEIFGLIGESGAGKSTLMRFINALEVPTRGHVIVDGIDVSTLGSRKLRVFQKDIGMIFQQFNLLNNKTVEENIRLPLELHKYEKPLSVEEVLSFVGLEDKRYAYPGQLSGGQKQRVGIARALITRPKILLCDEPTSALDERTTEEIIRVLKRAHQTFDVTIVIVTHELNVIKQLCDRAAVLEDGRIIDVISIENNAGETDGPVKSYYERVLEVLKDE
ncbi:methionine ABC transporter ATP-binding protein [Corticicoccus populi]|uniref:Methionine ABC transporter ATP-binding protein n=1 Tax=Corticicoccus populi TaxID=1812821 RepID=A0ABW5WX50_9STAP